MVDNKEFIEIMKKQEASKARKEYLLRREQIMASLCSAYLIARKGTFLSGLDIEFTKRIADDIMKINQS